jgi:hypothetical protein
MNDDSGARMPPRKRIDVEGWGPLAAGPHHPTTWDDVWISWKGRPGRPRTTLAPTLVGFDEFESQEAIARADPLYADEAAGHVRIRQQLETAPYVIDDIEPPNIYARKATIDRAEAERMLAFLLEQRYGIRNPKFRWKSRARGWRLTPVTLTPPS